jgi:hypothetical protein
MKKVLVIGFSILGVCFLISACKSKVQGDAYADVLKAFTDPPAEYRSAPLWVWNDHMTNEQIETQLADFQAHGIGGVFIHPRPGLITPYLSEEWLSLCRHAVDVGKSLGMKIWIYDENSYPSGFAGGHVPAEMPDSVGLGLRMTKSAVLPSSFTEKPILILLKTEAGFENITEQALQGGTGTAFGQGDYYIFDLQKAERSPWFGGFSYVDLMQRPVTEKFIDITLNAYKRAIGTEFGATVPGSFQDEAHIGPVLAENIVNYTPRLFGKFQEKWGYDLRPQLPSLFEETGNWRTVRYDFYATILDFFIENWAKPYYDYCAANNLWLTGHYLEHEWPFPSLTPDFLAMDAYAHMPGIDCLMNQWEAGAHGQFGNARPVKEIRSAANQLGRRRTMSETYGAGGWDLRFFDQKRIADWEFALGVNFINQHLSYVTIMGARKRDHPQSFSYHEPWWPAYKMMGDYLGRLSVVMSKGEQRNRILVLEPTTTAWMHYSPLTKSERLKVLEEQFTNFINRLEAAQVEYDLGSEDTIKKNGRAEGKKLIIGERGYDIVVLSPGLENLNEPTVELFSRYLEAGGKVVAFSEAPGFVNARESKRPAEIAAAHPQNWLNRSGDDGVNELVQVCARDIQFSGLDGDKTMFFHHRRQLADAELIFLANISPDKPMSGGFTISGKSAESWNPFTGEASPCSFKQQKGKVEITFNLPPGGSGIFCVRRQKGMSAPAEETSWQEITPEAEVEIRPESPNILTIDYCDLRIGNKEERNLYFYDAQRKTFEHHGLGRNPWDSAVQFKTNILDLDKFPPNSGFEATYWFTAAPGVELASLQLVIERPALYQVFINGQKVEPLPNQWWLDKAFGVFEIAKYAVSGKNRISLRATPFTIHTELEPIYLLGHFRLESQERGFRLIPAATLSWGPWSEQGSPLYSGGVSYAKTYDLSALNTGKEHYMVKLGTWQGSVAEVRVGEKRAGFIAFAPFELDITDFLSTGQNTVSVVVYGTLKNMLGPHHNNPPLGLAWPGMFQKGAEGGYPPGSAYSVVGYGLFEDFKVLAGAMK